MKRIVTLIVTVACLAFAGVAVASVDTNLVASVKRVQDYYPKWVVINGTHTAASGYFSGAFCSRQYVDTVNNQIDWLSYYQVFNVGTSTYSNYGNVVHLMNVVDTGKAC